MKKDTSNNKTQKRLTAFFGNDDNRSGATSHNNNNNNNKRIAATKAKPLSARIKGVGNSSFGSCPLCQKSFPLYKLESHASSCCGDEGDRPNSSLSTKTPKQETPKPPSTVTPNLIRKTTGNDYDSSTSSLFFSSSSAAKHNTKPKSPLPYQEPIPGLWVFEDFLTPQEETAMLRHLDFEDVVPWKESRFNGKSRGKRWGVHCNLRDRRVDAPQHPLPDVVQEFIRSKLLPQIEQLLPMQQRNRITLKDFVPNEANAIDYRRQEGHWLQDHVDDRQLSKEPIVNLSLAGDCIMTFCNQKQKQPHNSQERHRVLLKRRTMQILTGKARYDFSHGIAHADLLSNRRVSM